MEWDSKAPMMDLEVHLTIIWAPHQSDKAQEDQVRAQMGVSTGVKREVTKKDGEEVLYRNTKETPGAIEEALETNGRNRTMKSTKGMMGMKTLVRNLTKGRDGHPHMEMRHSEGVA